MAKKHPKTKEKEAKQAQTKLLSPVKTRTAAKISLPSSSKLPDQA